MTTRSSLIFDCDGVLLDTNAMKCGAFAAAVSDYPGDAVKPFLEYQSKSFGLSRYVIFAQFFVQFLGREPLPGEKERLLERFASQVEEDYVVSPETPGMLKVIDSLRAQYELHVASGSDEAELCRVFARRGLTSRFRSVLGSPTAKKENVRRIVADSSPVVAMIGDARSDFDAAKANGVPFIFMAGYSTVRDDMQAVARDEGFPVIEDLRELESALATISAGV